MILVSGILADRMIEWMCLRLDALGYEYLFLDEMQFPAAFPMTWEAGPAGISGSVMAGTQPVDLAAITGVYARYVDRRDPEDVGELSQQEHQLAQAEYRLSLIQLFDLLPCVVVNRARSSTSNDSKLYQRLAIEAFGFLTPRTLVTTIPDEALAFAEACQGQVIYKSLSGVRSIVQPFSAADPSRLNLLPNCPTQFQEYVNGVDIRVHTVGDEAIATEIVSEASDYRYAARQGLEASLQPTELPPDIAAACVGLARALGLVVAGIDLRRIADGRFYCFEVNPSPAFVYYERMAGQPISEAVAKLLRGH